MDTTFHQYLKSNVNTIGTTVIDFFEKNNLNCDISLLWHNTFFTDYKYNSYLKEYKKILCYIYENKIEVIRPLQLIEENKFLTDNLLQTQQKLLQAEEKIIQLEEEIVSLKSQKQSKSIKDYFGKK